MPYLDVNGVRLYYEDHGQGQETLVFAHSLLFNLRMFDAQVECFKDRYRCITFDFRGQGKSEVAKTGYDMDTLCEDTAPLIRKLEIGPCHFIGLSMGGFVGMRIGFRYPELLRSLVILDSSADPEPEKNLPWYKKLQFVARWISIKLVVKPVLPIMFGQPFLNDPLRIELKKSCIRELKANHPKGVQRAVNGVFSRPGIASEISKIHTPTLIMVGENDKATPPKLSEKMHKLIPGSHYRLIPRAGHMSTIEEPDFVNAALGEFWKDLK